MTTENMIAGFQDYYGLEYQRGQGRMLVHYLDKIADNVKPYLFAAVLKKHSSTFKSLPDIAILDGCYDDAWTEAKLDSAEARNPVLLPSFDELATEEEIEQFKASLVEVIAKWRKQA